MNIFFLGGREDSTYKELQKRSIFLTMMSKVGVDLQTYDAV
jgi:hypothetical protein